MADLRLDGRVALVTGAGRGIGATTAQRMALAGAAVAVNDLDGDVAAETAGRIAAASGRPSIAVQADVSRASEVERMIAHVERELGGVDVLVSNAGVLRNAPLGQMTEADWDAVIDVHLKGAFLCSRAVQAGMVERRHGKILVLSSAAAWGSSRGHANYSAAKAGLIGLVRTLALELGPSNVNGVAPGAIVTDMTRATAAQLGLTFEEYRRVTAERVALRRLGRPEEVAEVLCFLASEAARHVNGQVIRVDGGSGR